LAILQIDEHLMLRPYQSTDADLLFAAIDRERKHLGPWLGWVAHTTRPKHSLALPLGIFFKGEIVGGIGMHDWIQDTKCAQVGYWIAKEHEGKGIVARSVTALLDYLFVVVGINKAEIRFVVANNRSAALAHRLGFKTEGILRQSFTRNGMIEDLVVTGMLKSEWVQREQ
jgi:ribosomal-protein-serine acetyltransferase